MQDLSEGQERGDALMAAMQPIMIVPLYHADWESVWPPGAAVPAKGGLAASSPAGALQEAGERRWNALRPALSCGHHTDEFGSMTMLSWYL